MAVMQLASWQNRFNDLTVKNAKFSRSVEVSYLKVHKALLSNESFQVGTTFLLAQWAHADYNFMRYIIGAPLLRGTKQP